ncbi:hypothetical protein OG21DRAFT_1527392 [Imleria badia]|nr:hypothetical protein OG21DRAFT_1527392 [Imleria badia]
MDSEKDWEQAPPEVMFPQVDLHHCLDLEHESLAFYSSIAASIGLGVAPSETPGNDFKSGDGNIDSQKVSYLIEHLGYLENIPTGVFNKVLALQVPPSPPVPAFQLSSPHPALPEKAFKSTPFPLETTSIILDKSCKEKVKRGKYGQGHGHNSSSNQLPANTVALALVPQDTVPVASSTASLPAESSGVNKNTQQRREVKRLKDPQKN